MTAPVIAGIGYEKATQADFLACLAEAGIHRLVDVRDRPQSRRAGFSKSQLAAACAEHGIDYHHLKPLGTPPEGRAAHRSGDQATFWRIVKAQLATAPACDALDRLDALARERSTALVCYEAEWRHCHRALVLDRLAARGFKVEHLTVAPIA